EAGVDELLTAEGPREEAALVLQELQVDQRCAGERGGVDLHVGRLVLFVVRLVRPQTRPGGRCPFIRHHPCARYRTGGAGPSNLTSRVEHPPWMVWVHRKRPPGPPVRPP